ncbi:unnamed protein product [Ectocarpus fasciculatus]
MGGAASSRRATASNFPLQDWSPENDDWGRRQVLTLLSIRFEPASRMEQKGEQTTSDPFPAARKRNTHQDRQENEPLAAHSAGVDGLESDERSQRQNTFTTLQDEVHKKRTVGMSYNEIFSELAAKAKGNEAAKKGASDNPRRLTVGETNRFFKRQVADNNTTPISKGFRGIAGERDDTVDRDATGSGDKNQPHTQGPAARYGGHVDAPRRQSSDEDSEELFPGFVEEKGNLRRLTGSGSNGKEKAEGGREGADAAGCATSFSNSFRDPDRVSGMLSSSRTQRVEESTNKPSRRAQIFDKGVDASMMQDLMNNDAESDVANVDGTPRGGLGRTVTLQNNTSMGEQSADIVVGALRKFFFLEHNPEEEVSELAGGGTSGGGMAMLMRAMEREEHEEGTSVMEQGEEGHHMSVVEEGSLEVIIDDEAIRVIGVGDRFGELALLYNAPRSATVRTLTPCVLWSIHREVFKAVQALTASMSLIARSTHLYHVPWLRLLSTADLSKLAACCETAQYRDGDVILRKGEETDRCFLIESGEVICSTQQGEEEENIEQPSTEGEHESKGGEGICERVERLMMVARPGTRAKSPGGSGSPSSSGAPPPARPRTARHSMAGSTGGDGSGGRAALSRVQGRLNLGGVNGMGAIRSDCQPYWDEDRGEVVYGKGCFLGVPVLLASAELDVDGLPGWDLSVSSQFQRQGAEDEKSAQRSFTALSPVQIAAKGEVKIGHFDVSRFTKTVGPFDKVLGGVGDGGRLASSINTFRDRKPVSRQSLVANPGVGLALKSEKLTVHSFEQMEFLGQGSFGFVTVVRKKQGVMKGNFFALKSLSKRGVVEGGQVQHIKDEKTVLELFNHPFVLRLYTTFQDANRVYFLTELLIGGELWSVIYESSSGFSSGLPPDHVMFYSAVVVDAVGYMHSKGIAYRDLKPENLIVDDSGYLRIIDMGFAKRIPFFVTVGGETQMHPRSHTMCGTPEYLAPEFIFNKGHDQSADLWALGVLMFELVEARTPFVLPGSEQDVAQLFTNIACVKKKGVDFPDDFDEKAGGGAACRDVISGMLAFEPGDRLGNHADGMNDVKMHAMFSGLDWDRLEAKLIPAPWVPDEPAPSPEPETPNVNDVYTGNQECFSDF